MEVSGVPERASVSQLCFYNAFFRSKNYNWGEMIYTYRIFRPPEIMDGETPTVAAECNGGTSHRASDPT